MEDVRIGLPAGWRKGVREERCFMKGRFSYSFLHYCYQDHHDYHHHHHKCAANIMNVNEFFCSCFVSGIIRLQKTEPGHKMCRICRDPV